MRLVRKFDGKIGIGSMIVRFFSTFDVVLGRTSRCFCPKCLKWESGCPNDGSVLGNHAFLNILL